MSKIKVGELKKAFTRIIEKLEYENVDEIEFLYDMYRIIPTHKWTLIEPNSDEIHIGSLSEDIESINLLVNDDKRMCTYVDFDRVATILRAISEAQNPAD